MEYISLKKPRLDLPETIAEKSVPCEETVEHMDIAECEGSSHPNEKKSEVENTESNTSRCDELMVQKERKNNESPEESIDVLFTKFFVVSDRKNKNMINGKKFGPSQYHLWGIMAKIKESSRTLRELNTVNLKNISNCKVTFMNILEELELEYSVVKLDSQKPTEFPCILAFDIKSTPKYSFIGCGATEDVATNEAAKKGLNFFVALC